MGETGNDAMTRHVSPEMTACIEACSTCHALCVDTLHYCLVRGGNHAAAVHIGVVHVCADLCAVSVSSMRLGVDECVHICRACADVCEACADSCEMHGNDDMLTRCAAACRHCAEACRRMAA